MENKGIINCPNCQKRIFADSEECPYCKYSLKEEKHNFDNEIYNFLYCKYNENKNKPETIKVGMEKFNKSMKEIKEMVDYISEETYNKEVVEKKSQPKEELPTNGIDYSKIKYVKSYHGVRIKFPTCVAISLIIYWLVLIIGMVLWKINSNNDMVDMYLVIAIFFSIVVSSEIYMRYTNIPWTPQTFIFSFTEYFIHNIMHKILIITLLTWLVTQFVPFEYRVSLYFIVAGVAVFGFIIELSSLVMASFTVDYGNIRYSTINYMSQGSGNGEHIYSWFYLIHSIKEVKETFSSIIIYGYIEEITGESMGVLAKTRFSKPRIYKCLKVKKCFRNNKNLVKALKVCAENKN